jgi:P-type E1-E2 ATPase
MGLQPDFVSRMVNGEEQEVSIKLVMVNDLLLVPPGERVAVDGEVTDGESYVDESMLTGEPHRCRQKAGRG